MYVSEAIILTGCLAEGITGNEAVRLLSYCKRRVNSLGVIYVAEFWSIKVNQIYFEDIHFSFNMEIKIRHRKKNLLRKT